LRLRKTSLEIGGIVSDKILISATTATTNGVPKFGNFGLPENEKIVYRFKFRAKMLETGG
jgi:hypothetical protein